MLKKFIFSIGTLLAIIAIYSFNNPAANFKGGDKGSILFFRGSWSEALTKAKTENKLIFLDIYATWCGPCKKLKNKTFTSRKVASYFNEHFVNVSIDGEEGEGLILSNKYNLEFYPTMYFIDSTGTVRSAATGYYNPNEFLRLAKSVH